MEPISENRISFTECLSNLIFGIILPTWDVFSDIYFGYSLMKKACRFRQKTSFTIENWCYFSDELKSYRIEKLYYGEIG